MGKTQFAQGGKAVPKMIRMNLAEGLTTDPVSTVDITFDKDTKVVSFTNSTGNDVHVDTQGDNNIQFNLTVTGSAAGSASIAGVAFPGSQPGGDFMPSKVFHPVAGTVPGTSPAVKLYGEKSSGNLTLTDDDEATANEGTEEYEYQVWVCYEPGGNSPAEYYSLDPKIFNEPPPG